MMEQRSDEWFTARLGKITASRINDVMATIKSGGESSSRKNYRAQLVVERLTGQKADSYTNGAMMWGTEQEPFARQSYEFFTGNDVVEVGFIEHPTIEMSGASPDGLVGDDGMIEIKCPNTATHIDWLLAGVVPSEHVKQMQWQMECMDREWCDFVSYDPRLPVDLQLFIIRCERDYVLLNEIRAAVIKLLSEVDEQVAALETLKYKSLFVEYSDKGRAVE
jgi:putative phage-type endonuclease